MVLIPLLHLCNLSLRIHVVAVDSVMSSSFSYEYGAAPLCNLSLTREFT
jgi:hypothetical protein